LFIASTVTPSHLMSESIEGKKSSKPKRGSISSHKSWRKSWICIPTHTHTHTHTHVCSNSQQIIQMSKTIDQLITRSFSAFTNDLLPAWAFRWVVWGHLNREELSSYDGRQGRREAVPTHLHHCHVSVCVRNWTTGRHST
jgi:hypothetical protein